MYEDDSFFTLSLPGQLGLLALSACLFLLTLAALWRIARNRPLFWRLTLTLALFGTFVWVSPQIYYQYYCLIIDGLPAQWVIGGPPSPRHLFELPAFRADANLSHQAQGALGWAMVTLAILRRRPRVA